MSTGVVLAVL